MVKWTCLEVTFWHIHATPPPKYPSVPLSCGLLGVSDCTNSNRSVSGQIPNNNQCIIMVSEKWG